MRIAMIGAGCVGLVAGACFAEFDIDACVVDIEIGRIEALREGRTPGRDPEAMRDAGFDHSSIGRP